MSNTTLTRIAIHRESYTHYQTHPHTNMSTHKHNTQDHSHTMSSALRRKLKICTHNSVLRMENLHEAFPLPEAPPELCRDAFLQELLKPYELESESDSISSDSSLSANVHFGKTTKYSASFNAEEKLLTQMRKTMDARGSVSTVKSDTTRMIGTDLTKLLNTRYGNIAYALGFVAVLFQLQELRNRMRIIRKMWGMNTTTDKSLHMFSWSIKDYFTRFSLPNESYLDAVERELGNEIECFKFRVDVKEVERLLGALIDDFRSKTEICNSSMLLIKDAELNVEELLTKSQKEAAAEHNKIALASLKAPRSPDPDRSRTKAVYAKYYHIDFVYPIEARYRIKWAQTTMEQSIMYDNLNLNEINDEIMQIKDEMEKVSNLWEISSITYDMQIMEYQNRISNREMAYESSLYEWDMKITTTRLRLAKCKDDLKYYREQIPIFHRKIAEVQALLYQQEAANRQSARSRKSSRHSSLRKKAQQVKK